MATVEVFDVEKNVVGSVELDAAVFGVEVRAHLFHAAVRYQLAKRRAGTHATKGRALVSGGGKKPYRQKGTGRARQGSTRSPHYRGGGVVHGPHFRDHSHKMPKRVRRAALAAALSRRTEESKLLVLDQVTFAEWKTKSFVGMLKRFSVGSAVVVLDQPDEMVSRVARNIPGVTVLPAVGVNVYDILRHEHLIVTRSAVDAIVDRLKG